MLNKSKIIKQPSSNKQPLNANAKRPLGSDSFGTKQPLKGNNPYKGNKGPDQQKGW